MLSCRCLCIVGLKHTANCIVEETLYDRLVWYRADVAEEQRKSPKVSVGAIARSIQRSQDEVSSLLQKPYLDMMDLDSSLATCLAYSMIARRLIIRIAKK